LVFDASCLGAWFLLLTFAICQLPIANCHLLLPFRSPDHPMEYPGYPQLGI
jgi:hypothetical protein